MNPKLDEYLNNLILAIETQDSSMGILQAIDGVLIWLNEPQNNTNKNCREVDYFIMNEVVFGEQYANLPEDIRSLIFDMGGQLHDTHTNPDIAENFESTPKQLLERTRQLMAARDG